MKKWFEIFGIALLTAAVLSTLFPASVSAGNGNNSTTLEINISVTCGLTVNASALSFGNLTAGETSTERSLNLSNIGSTTATLTINGSKWFRNDGAEYNFSSNQTHWSTTQGFAYDNGNYINATQTGMGFALANGDYQVVYYRVRIPTGQRYGSYNQTIAITSTC